ncbi:hypothetical protein XELAEV_18024293mg [Xenopus laevis]|uniref:Mucin-5AC n=1 Tax=Xenopus laevis TaxID=8355 RepID=A0A974HL33_XENLA|nr:hypothetical protein XELAEV_18024293mg [Xenopus laevis]
MYQLSVVVNTAHNNKVCSTWGNFNFKNFDGDIFHFPGICNYVYASHCKSDYEDFNIQIQRTVTNSIPEISKITMKINGVAIQLSQNSVIVDGAGVQLPYSGSGVQIEKKGIYLKITSKLRLVLMWNDDNSLLLELDEKYANQTCGLCGDYNGMSINNEFINHGVRITETQFGNLQRLDGPTEQCQDVQPIAKSNCTDFENICEKILLGSAFANCHSKVAVEPYIEACAQDLCRCDSSVASLCLCNTFAEYSRQCAHAGGQPTNWRTNDFCPQKCPFNMEYRECDFPCADTCTNQERAAVCKEHCLEGCYCPKGTVFDDINNSGCIPVDMCPCTVRGEIYTSGASYSTPCSTCSCSSGKWNCKDLPCPSTCSVEGGSHITTYDQTHYSIHGDCNYVLTKTCHGGDYTVVTELRKCGLTESEICLKSIMILLNGGETMVVIKPCGSVYVNNVYTQLPLSTASVTIFKPSSFYIIVHTQLGLQVVAQLTPFMQVYAVLDPVFKTKTCGLCGNFNDKQSDDFQTISGAIEGTGASFANSWKIQASCTDIKNIYEDPCSISVENEQYASHWCDHISDRNGLFAACHSTVNPEMYKKNCMYDTCNCQKSEDCMCAALSSYSRACASKGVILKGWQAGTPCTKYTKYCPKTLTYNDSISACQPTCRSRFVADPTCNIKFPLVDGCRCTQGFYMDDSGKCVPEAACPCYYKESPIPSGEVVHDNGIQCSCTQGQLSCIGSAKPECAAPMVYFDCKNVTEDTIGSECQKSCQTLDMECYRTKCVSGCVCPGDLVSDGKGGCIKEDQCPCVHNEATYRPGDKIKEKCNTCTCKNRKWQCTNEPCLGTCAVYGDGHYITFDGKRYSFNGDCEYILAQDHCSKSELSGSSFRVITENVPCGTTGTTCSKAIKVFLGSFELVLTNEHFDVMRRESGAKVPYKIRHMGIYLVIESDSGLILLWDKKTGIFIKLSKDFEGKVCGLCGNYDGNGNNDFTTRSLSVVGDPLEFGNSWKLNPTCPDVTPTRDPCSANPYRKSWAQKQCSIINGKAFSDCHSQLDPSGYYDACVTDSCACDSGGDCECMCDAIAAYALACSEAGICVSWRTPSICPIFCDYYNSDGECEWHYKPCEHSCKKTCRNPTGKCLYDLPAMEGCYPSCSAEKPFFDEDAMDCVPQCGCYDDEGNHYPRGAEIPSKENCQTCVCSMSSHTECKYDNSACYCMYNGTKYHYDDVIYNTRDNTGGCLSAICKENGTILRDTLCSTTTPTTTFVFTKTTPKTATATTTTKPIVTTICVQKVCEWSQWIDGSYPGSESDSGDFDTYDNLRAKGYHICIHPEDIECRAERFPDTPLSELEQNIECNASLGLLCYNKDQLPPICYNYEIRVKCCEIRPCGFKTSAPTTITHPTTTITIKSTTTLTTPKPSAPTTIETTPTTPIESSPTSHCKPQCKWTDWIDIGLPGVGEGKGDFETYDKIRAEGIHICKKPDSIQCRAEKYPDTAIDRIGQVVQCDLTFGLVCKNEEQKNDFKECLNYQVKVLCCDDYSHCSPTTTSSVPTTTKFIPTHSITTPVPTTTSTETTTSTTETTTTPTTTTTETTTTPTTTTTETTTTPTTTTTETTTTTTGTTTTPTTTTTETTTTPTTTTTETTTTPTTTTTETTPTTTTTETTTTPTTTTTETTTTTTTTTTETTTPTTTETTTSPTTTTTETTTTPTTTTTETTTTPTTTPTETTTTPTTTTTETTTISTTTTTETFIDKHVRFFFTPGEMIYSKMDHEGCHFYAMCNDLCEAERFQGPCSPTTTATPKFTTTVTTKKTTTEIASTAFTGCQPDKKPNESWKINNCTTATCLGHNVITYDSVKCPEVKEITCDNSFPPVKVFSQDGCCFHYECQCVCSGWGDPHYITFDGIYYTFLENCTYVLVQQITPKYDNFRVLVDNYFCDALDGLSCPQSIMAYYKNNEVLLTRMMFEGNMRNRIRFNKAWTTPGFTTDGITVTSAGIKMIVEIPEIGAYISFSGMNFVVNLPYSKFGYNTEGQCGVCSNNRSDECRLPDGKVVQDCSQMANHWKVKVPEKPYCNIPPPTVPPSKAPPVPTTTCPPSSLCDVILSEVFAECHNVIPPTPYHEGCVYDACRVRNHSVECASLEVYASLCISNGVCVDWREKTHGRCPYDCPAEKVYNACGPVHPTTCEQNDINKVSDYETEGCYCPKGTVLYNSFSGICVPQKCEVCPGPDGTPMNVGDSWTSGCNKCTCQKTPLSTKCEPLPCSEPETETCDKDGFVPEEVFDPSEPCCKKYKCMCKPSNCLNDVKSCPLGFEAISTIMEGDCCPSFDCKPMDVCVVDDITYKPGSTIPKAKGSCDSCECTDEKDTRTSLNKVKCTPTECNEDCSKGHQYTEVEGECCGKCEQVECIMTEDNTTIVIKPGDIWTSPDEPCIQHECHIIEDQFVPVTLKKTCDCPLGYQFKAIPEKCCNCIATECSITMSDNTTKLLQPGESMPSPEDKCKSFYCTHDYEVIYQQDKCTITEPQQCLETQEYEKEEGACCGICKTVACSVKMNNNTAILVKPGETYTPEDNKCISYKCSLDYEVENHMEKCSYTEQSDCLEGYTYEKEEDECCGKCVQVACVMKMEDEKTQILKPGDVWTQPDEPCIQHECHIIEDQFVPVTLKKTCDCPLGYEYKAIPGKCCNCIATECSITMSDNTTKLLQPGESIPSPEDKCKSFYCTHDYEVIYQQDKCTITEPQQCLEGYEYQKPVDGDCCGTCKQVACVMKTGDNSTNVLKPGETYTPEDEKCISYKCTLDFNLENLKEKCAYTEQEDCTEGTEYQKPVDGDCCGKCIPVACVMKMSDSSTKVLKPGETYTPEEDECTTYICKSDYELETHKEKCPITKQSDCLEGYKYEKKVGDCCGTCVQVACVMKMDDNTTKVLKPGETYIPKEDKCTAYVCKPDLLLETLTEKCPIIEPCFDGQEYQRMESSCCPICPTPIGCVMKMYDNTTKFLKPGEIYTPEEDKCISYVCKPDFELETLKEKCPITDRSDCSEGYEYEKKVGDCCGTCVQVACVMKMDDNTTKFLKPGEIYTPEYDKCISYECKSDFELEILKEKCPITDQSDCLEGYEYEKKAGDCCGTCVQVACVMKMDDNTTKVLKPGETYTPESDKCISYNCSTTYDVIKLMESCPAFDAKECKENKGTIKTTANGCCKICELPSTKTACLVNKESKFITYGTCESEQKVEMTYCEGTCNTKSIYSDNSNSMEHTCSCCQEMKTSQRQVDLKCSDGSKSVYSYTYVEECGCTSTECQDNTQQSKKKF